MAGGGLSWFDANEALIQAWLVLCILGFSFYTALRSGAFSVAGIGTWAIGAYTAGKLTIAGVDAWIALIASCLLGAAVGLVMALVLARLRSLYLAMATFAFVLLVQVIARNWKSFTGGGEGLYGIPPTLTTSSLVAIALAATVLVWFTERGRAGRTLEYMRRDEVLARTLGVHTNRARAMAFVFSSILGALSGACNAMLFNLVTPDQAGFSLVVDGLTVVVLGGIGAFYGPLIGAAVVTAFPYLLDFISVDWRLMVQGLIIVFMTVYFPRGIVGLVRYFNGLYRKSSQTPARALEAEGR